MKLFAPAAVTRMPNPDTSASYVIAYPLSGDCNLAISLSVILSAIAFSPCPHHVHTSTGAPCPDADIGCRDLSMKYHCFAHAYCADTNEITIFQKLGESGPDVMNNHDPQ